MTWTIQKHGPGEFIISDETNVVRGSISALIHFRVEIMWWGPGGDITKEFDNYKQAEAFIRGIEIASDRWQRVIAKQITEHPTAGHPT